MKRTVFGINHSYLLVHSLIKLLRNRENGQNLGEMGSLKMKICPWIMDSPS